LRSGKALSEVLFLAIYVSAAEASRGLCYNLSLYARR